MEETNEMISKVRKKLFKSRLLCSHKEYFNSDDFSVLLTSLAQSNNESEYEESLRNLTTSITKNTDIKFDYVKPIIWDNWGKSFVGSGIDYSKIKYGFSSGNEFKRIVDLKMTLNIIISEIFDYYKQNKNQTKVEEEDKIPKIWTKLVESTEPFKTEEWIEMKITLGKIWLDSMTNDDMKKLQITTKCSCLSQKNNKVELSQFFLKLSSYAESLASEKGIELTCITPQSSRGSGRE